MFGNSRNNGKTPVRPPAVESLIGARMSIHGDVEFAGGMHVDGHISGSVVASGRDGTLTLTENGRIEGRVEGACAIINGHVTGDLCATERVELAANARVDGDVHYRMLQVAAGAQVNGRLVRLDEQRALPGLEHMPHALPAPV